MKRWVHFTIPYLPQAKRLISIFVPPKNMFLKANGFEQEGAEHAEKTRRRNLCDLCFSPVQKSKEETLSIGSAGYI